jgi:hypothetical protein
MDKRNAGLRLYRIVKDLGWIAGSASLYRENIRQVGRPVKAQGIFAVDHCPEGFR